MIDPTKNGCFLILSDTHSNEPALRAVWEWAKSCPYSIEGFASLGDQIGYGPFPQETLDLFTEMYDAVKGKAVFLRGNHESAVWGMEDLSRWNPHAVRQVDWTRRNITNDSIILDGDDPIDCTHSIQTPGGLVTLVHDNFMLPGEGDYIMSHYDAQINMNSDKSFKVGFFGHTHVPRIYCYKEGRSSQEYFEPGVWFPIMSGRYAINPGSVGQPRDGDPRASFMVYDPLKMEVLNVRLEYDIDKTAQAVYASDLEDRLGERLYRGH